MRRAGAGMPAQGNRKRQSPEVGETGLPQDPELVDDQGQGAMRVRLEPQIRS